MCEILSATVDCVVNVDEIDYKERLKISAVLQYFQDIATSHADELGIGYARMKQENLIWVLSRLSFVVDEYPKLADRIKVTTFPKAARAADAVRDYYITDAIGNVLIRGSSKWCVVDIEKKSIKRCSQFFPQDRSSFTDRSAVAEGNPLLPDIRTLGEPLEKRQFRVNITDLDRNIHMNNARYGDVITNCCNMDIYDKRSIHTVDINFISELKFGAEYSVERIEGSGFSFFEASSGGKVIFRARIGWKN